MSQLGPYWADAIAATIKSGDEVGRAEVTGAKPRRCMRIDWTRRIESAARGGRKGGKNKKGKRHG